MAISWFFLSRALPVPLLLTGAIVTAERAIGADELATRAGGATLAPAAVQVSPVEPFEAAAFEAPPASRMAPVQEPASTGLLPFEQSALPVFLAEGAPVRRSSNAGPAPIAALLPGRLPGAPTLATGALEAPALVAPARAKSSPPAAALEPSSGGPDLSANVRERTISEPALAASPMASPRLPAGTMRPLRLDNAPALAIENLAEPGDLLAPLALLAASPTSLAASRGVPAAADGGERLRETQVAIPPSARPEEPAALAVSGPGATPLTVPQAGSASWDRLTQIAPLAVVAQAPAARWREVEEPVTSSM